MKVVSKQNNSKMCIICGCDNEAGLKAPFYNLEDGTVGTVFQYRPIHQSYPERVHGGLITTMIDELAGRVLWVDHPDLFGVTMSIMTRYKKPVPYDEPLKGIGRLVSITAHGFKANCEIYDLSGKVLACGEATYALLPVEAITNENPHLQLNVYIPDDVKEFSI